MLMPVLSRLRPFAALAATGLALAACDRETTPPPATPAEPPAATPPAPTPVLTPALDRAGLLEALAQAASAYAAGRPAEGQDALVGRQFSIRSAFGCAGPEPRPSEAPGDGVARWSWDEARETIRLTLNPGDWSDSALVAGAVDGQWEAVEGFWVPRPWMTAEGCPGVRPDPLAGPPTPSPQTAGLAAVFEAGGSRLGRRNGRAYSYTVRGEGDAAPARPSDGWRVLMEGRFVAFPDGRAIRCRAAGPDQRPVCVAAVQMDRVAFLTADGATLGEWRTG
ncbi:MAG: hypothetical protein A2623_06305 [Caulobacterales bacterium RIFCSPHIGHO2_01_FULL_70_19]|nr:MAG: hypothetical protein A2623_06305 [Caulobacterales bacterium RIFCSPHIGHO2_01_FULL_70_19]